ncbi:glycine zipper 2TM domain-containing protein [Comamonas flocculans]|uniref:Glycine zipper 2TM domain-containing protein n=1 Tax=Comamonas flocculans TaxID=2597701 RepID=A0A5B8RQ81_9BURK|nr:glycine zipper 2TM domain-containing protein [Comamonas flocculans]QEA11770.1 glycine zipper 2TM domain-containing protein [Comamonas flocculans]
MKKTLALTLVASAAFMALPTQAQPQGREMGRVLSVTPVTQQVAVPQQLCRDETIYSGARQPSGAGAVLGAVAGGLVGNAIGGGSGRAAATAAGVIGGAMLGNSVESGGPGYRTVQRCSTQTRYDSQFLGYDVVYEYGGRQYTTRTQADPGQWIPVTVQPAVAPASGYPQDYGYYDDAPQPAVVVRESPAYTTPVYTSPVYVAPPVTATIEYRSGGGWDHGWRHHRR